MSIATATAPANIAFVKYWGNRDASLRLPCHGSLSMSLDAASTTTTVRFAAELATDRLILDGTPVHGPALERVSRQLDLIRVRAGERRHAWIVSRNTFPAGTGIASSASAFAALTLAASAAAGLRLDERELSALARRGSGSAARSVPAGFVEWYAADRDEDSYARSIAGPDYWNLADVVAVVSREHKAVGSSDGHQLAATSPCFASRLAGIAARLDRVRRAILERDLATLGPEIEAEALSLHAVAMTAQPALLYWQPETVALLHQTRAWRGDGLAAYFTLDAGPNVHLVCDAAVADETGHLLGALGYVKSVLPNHPAGAAYVHARPDAESVDAWRSRGASGDPPGRGEGWP